MSIGMAVSLPPRWAEITFAPLSYDRDVLYVKSLTMTSLSSWIALSLAIIACLVLLKFYIRMKNNHLQTRILLDINKRELVDAQEEIIKTETRGKEELSRSITGLL